MNMKHMKSGFKSITLYYGIALCSMILHLSTILRSFKRRLIFAGSKSCKLTLFKKGSQPCIRVSQLSCVPLVFAFKHGYDTVLRNTPTSILPYPTHRISICPKDGHWASENVTLTMIYQSDIVRYSLLEFFITLFCQ